MYKFIASLSLILSTLSAWAQNVNISGYVRDQLSGENIIGAVIYVVETGDIATTNNYGYYSFSLPSGTYTLQCIASLYQQLDTVVNCSQNLKLDFNLLEESTQLEGVEVTAQRKDVNVYATQMGVNTLTAEQVKKLPVIFGETDILKAIQLLPGVQSAGEANAGFYVRGGGPDQNLILLDEAVVYNSGHLFGFFSIFNSDAIKNATLTKGGIGANYGGRLSSVLDVTMNDGNNKSFHGEGGIGLIASRLTLEGPIVKDKGSFIISGRRTYVDVITKPFLKQEFRNNGYYFYDANIKANYKLGDKDRIYLSGYFGRDVFTFSGSSGNFSARIPWGNKTATLRWNHLWSDKLFMNLTAIYNDYDFELQARQTALDIRFLSAIQDLGAKVDFDYFLNNNHSIKFGGQYTYHRFLPNQFSGSADSVEFKPNNAFKKYGHEMAVYALDEFNLGEAVRINAGIRYSWFTQVGPYKQYIFTPSRERADSIVYAAGEPVITYGGFEPRLNARIRAGENSSFKLGITRSMQYLHLVANNGSTLPTDIYVPSSAVVKPQYSWQYAAGYFHNWLDNALETSVEVYYKDLRNQIEYRNGYTPGLGDPEWDFVFGRGYAYGAEFLVNKTKGKLTGWVGYTLSWTWREFPELNNGKRFPAKYDRRHDLSVVATYELNKKWTFSGVLVYGSGNAITLPTELYFIEGNLIQNFSELNQYRIPAYHRMDLSATWTPKGDQTNKKFKSSWSFSLYNVYSRLNPYFMYLDFDGNLANGTKISVKKVSIFPIIPSITWNFSF